jgi:hypothetical protein
MPSALSRSVASSTIFLGLALLSLSTIGTKAQSASRCPAFPSFPDASCTGTLPGIARTSSGSITTSSDGQLIQNLNISGKIVVRHHNVTIRNVKITNPNGVAISNNQGGTGLVIEDCELDGTGNTTGASAVDYSNYILRRCNIHHFGEGPGANVNVLIEDNYFHSFTNQSATGAHQDCIQAEFGRNVTIRHNACWANGSYMNAAIVIGRQSGNIGNVVEYNLMAGGGYTLYMGEGKSRHNRWSTVYYSKGGAFGPIYDVTKATHCDERWSDGANAGNLVAGAAACDGGITPPQPPYNVRVITN